MDSKTFFYLAGLPRTGSTVLGEILNQNEHIHVSPASPLSEIVSSVLNLWRANSVTVKAYHHPEQLPNVWRAIREGFYQHRPEPVIIDKSWAWHMNDAIDSARKILGEEMKVICTVDDVAACVASFIMRIRSHPDYVSYIDEYLRGQGRELNDANRCAALMDPRIATSVGWCYENLKQTWQGRNRKNLLLVERADLVRDPGSVITQIYDFLGIPELATWGDGQSHRYDRIEKEISEDDGAAYGIPDLHRLGPTLRDRTWQARDVLGNQLFYKFKRMEFWRAKKARI